MANADPGPGLAMQEFYDDDIDSEDEDEEASTSGNGKQNGVVSRETDRYGFIGGDQYTDPER